MEIEIDKDERIHTMEEEFTEQMSASMAGIKKTQAKGVQGKGYGKLLSILACGAYYYVGGNVRFKK